MPGCDRVTRCFTLSQAGIVPAYRTSALAAANPGWHTPRPASPQFQKYQAAAASSAPNSSTCTTT